MEERRQAVGYIRVSTSEQASSGLSLEAQRRKVKAQAELSDLTLLGVLEDAGESACTLKRPAMTELLARIDSGQVDAVIIGKLDRLTRSVKDLSILLERMKKARRADGGKGVDLISTAESLDTGSATGRLVVNIMASVSQWEREVVSERTSAALQELRAQGRSTGNPPFGYKVNKTGVLIENRQEQALLQRVEQLRAGGNSWESVANALTGEGGRTRSGSAFSRQGIFHIARKSGIQ